MGLIFISHSSHDNTEAEAMREWLSAQGWGEVFLDLDPVAGLAPGQHWRDELRKAGERCSAVVVLVSPQWAASKWCLAEFLFASQLGKAIFPVMVEPCVLTELPVELTATYQITDVSTAENRARGLERLRIGLQRAGLFPGSFPWPPKDEPHRPIFRGLRVLEEQDAAIFFGRDAQITRALDTLRRLRDGAPERMFVVLGASGAGKSSFLRAGLLPRLKQDTESFLVIPTWRPGGAALTGATGLRRALDLDGPLDGARIAARLTELRAAVLVRLVNDALWRPENSVPPTVILPIDQAEELFIAGDEEAPAAVTAIAEAVRIDPNLVLVATIRTDSLGLLQGDPFLSAVPRLLFDLPRMPRAAFKEIIEGPTRLPGVGIEIEADLTDQLTLDFDGIDALPLLAFTLERLVTDHQVRARLRNHEYVDEMKGVGGAIRQAVEKAFAKAAETQGLPQNRASLDALAQRCFVPWLVRIDDAAASPKRRVGLRRRLPKEALPLIDCLVDQRLLVADTTGDEPTVEVSHEAVLRHWRELATWIADRRNDLIVSERVTAAARDWRAAEGATKKDALVHRGERLQTAETLLLWDDLRRQMGDDSVAYLAACRDSETREELAKAAQAQRQHRLRQWIGGLVAVAAVVTGLGAALVVRGQHNLSRAQSQALASAAVGLGQQGDYVRASRLSILATRSNWLMPASVEGPAVLSSSAQALKLSTEIRGHEGVVVGAVFSKDEARILTWSEDKTARLWNAATGAQVGPALTHDGTVLGAVFSKDEARILTWSEDKTARLWNAATGAQIARFTHDGEVEGAIFSKDEARILTWSRDKTARLWNTVTGVQIGPALTHDDWLVGAAFSKDDSRVLTWSTDGTARLWNAVTGRQIGRAFTHDHIVFGAVFSKDEARILTWSDDKTARLWNAATGAQIVRFTHDGDVDGAIFSKDEARILTWSDDKTARLWNAATGAQVGPALTHDGTVLGAVFSKDEARILTWSEDKTARLWNAATGAQVGPALTHGGEVVGAVFSKDEARILTWSADGTARLWNAATGAQVGPALTHDGAVVGAVFSKDDSRILTWSEDKTARIWNTATGAQVGPALIHDGAVVGAVFSKDDSRILTWGLDRTARLWNAATGAQIGPALTHNRAGFSDTHAVFSRDETRILTWGADGTARIWSAATGAQIGPALKHGVVGVPFSEVVGAGFSKDETRILTWSADKTARLWNAATGAQIGPALTHDDRLVGGVFSKDDSRILTWSADKTARLWNAGTGAQIGPALTHSGRVGGAVFSKDEARILTWSADETARLWNAATGAQIGPSLTHGDLVEGAVFSKDESRILTWSADKTARLWNAADGQQIGPALTHSGTVGGAVFSKDEARILTWSNDRTARLWNAATGAQIGRFTHDDVVRGAIFSKDEARILTWSADGTARLWNAATGAQISRFTHDDGVRGAIFSKDESRILTWSDDRTARLWDVHWAMRDAGTPSFVNDLCREKLVGTAVPSGRKILDGTNLGRRSPH